MESMATPRITMESMASMESMQSMLVGRTSLESIADCEPFSDAVTGGSCNGVRITTEELHSDLLGLLGETRAAALAKRANERRDTANDRKSNSVLEQDDESDSTEGEDGGDRTPRSKWARIRGNLRRLKGKEEADAGAAAPATLADVVAAAKIQQKAHDEKPREEEKERKEKPHEDSGLAGLGRFLPTTLPARKPKDDQTPGSQTHNGDWGGASTQMSASRHFEAQTTSVAQRVRHLRRMSAGFSMWDKEDRKAWRKKKCKNQDLNWVSETARSDDDDSSDDGDLSGVSLPSDDEDVQPIRLYLETM
jgi:hypothetical protein